MQFSGKNVMAKLALAAALLAASHVSFASKSAPAAEQGQIIHAQWETLIDEKIRFYNDEFPDIHFVHLRGGIAWQVDMTFLPALIGEGAASLDFEHPENLREDLLAAAYGRLQVMLQRGEASASLFRAGSRALARRGNVCIVTLNPEQVAVSDLETTRDMLDLPGAVFSRMHPARLLDAQDHLAFAIDHEVYHCLDSLYNGPIPMASEPYAHNYAFHRNENGADAFAVAMNIAKYGRVTQYARNIMNVRALALMNDPDHCTWGTIRHVLELKPQTVEDATVQQLFKVASVIREMSAPSYENYVQFRLAAHQVTAELGFLGEANGEQVAMRGNEGVIAALTQQTRFWYEQLFQDEPLARVKAHTRSFW